VLIDEQLSDVSHNENLETTVNPSWSRKGIGFSIVDGVSTTQQFYYQQVALMLIWLSMYMYYEQQLPQHLFSRLHRYTISGYNFIKMKIVLRDVSGISHARKSGKSS
jgi:hypothetical protein